LTAKLVDWDVQVRKDESQHEQFAARVSDAATGLAEELGLEPLIAEKLFRAGGATADLVIQMPLDYIAAALEMPEDEAKAILDKAKSVGTSGAAEATEEPEAAADADAAEEPKADTPAAEEPSAPEEEENKAEAAATEE
jgi:hypothetical protein